MNKIDYSNLGGFPGTQKTLSFMQDSYTTALAGMAALCGDKVIVSGVKVIGAFITAGWIVYNGELIPFLGGGNSANVIIEETSELVTFQDNSSRSVYFKKTARPGLPGTFPFSDLKRLNTLQELRWLPGDLKQVNCSAAYITANFDVNGIGINERVGWKICKEMGGRVAVGYSTVTIDPGDNVWDVVYTMIGAQGGEKLHKLTSSESGVAPHDHKFAGSGIAVSDGAPGIKLGAGQNEQNLGNTYTPDRADTVVNKADAQVAHENRQPFKVILYIEKL